MLTMGCSSPTEGDTEVPSAEVAALGAEHGCLLIETSSRHTKGVMKAFQRLGARP